MHPENSTKASVSDWDTLVPLNQAPLHLENNHSKLFPTKSLSLDAFKYFDIKNTDGMDELANNAFNQHISTKEYKQQQPPIWFSCDESPKDGDTSPFHSLDASSNSDSDNDLVIKKPVRKASSWNVVKSQDISAEKAFSAKNSSASQFFVSMVREGYESNNIEEEKVGSKFSLFPPSTDSDLMSSVRKNWNTMNEATVKKSTNLLSHSSLTGERLLSRNHLLTEQDNKMEDRAADNSSPHSGTFDSSKYDSEFTGDRVKTAKTSCLETAFKNLSVDISILPSI